ncbi:Rhamnogalacturonan acetylesterase RhgT [Streptomyces sp. RB5]|uniref:Rhamnogalacturonan acetylesterase RhgT n=1 Tax=Streptomyces smaragdinus TaxID=2585196 RepID=A0A7K0CQ46_9ACTN|nr:rhamnogalacturonan acetylesterase [Streptomyces smaragdinus]MQY15579.1 Rhamnogalacturonan acetylesterase RhgT [Streptomyces smaragdinus]
MRHDGFDLSAPGPRIFLAGGSSVVTRERKMAPMVGWGQVLHLYLRPEVQVVNCARAGASARTFSERGRLDWILQHIRPGDYLLASFGTNDAKPEKWLRTEAFGDFNDYLLRFVDGARERNAHPVLVSTHERDTYDIHGNLPRSITEYVMSMRELARQTSTPFINLADQSHAWWAEMGPHEIRRLFVHLAPGEHPNYLEGFDDPGHLVPAGAMLCARYIAYALAAKQIVPQDWVVNLDAAGFPEEAVEWLDDEHHAALTRARTLGAEEKS